ncbi:MAG: hypothetical protein ABJB69_09175 [Spartobacteria bacterium]
MAWIYSVRVSAWFQNRVVRTFFALFAILVFSGDVLDDVYDPGVSNVQSSHFSSHQGDGSPKLGSFGHDAAEVITPIASIISAFVSVFRYSDFEEEAPLGALPSIDHPPQLAEG